MPLESPGARAKKPLPQTRRQGLRWLPGAAKRHMRSRRAACGTRPLAWPARRNRRSRYDETLPASLDW